MTRSFSLLTASFSRAAFARTKDQLTPLSPRAWPPLGAETCRVSQSINRSRLMATACALRVHCCAAHVGTQPPPARRPIGADARHTEAAGPGHRPPVRGSRRLSMMCTSSHSHVPSGQAGGPARNVWLASGGRQTALRDRRFFLPPVRLQGIRGPR